MKNTFHSILAAATVVAAMLTSCQQDLKPDATPTSEAIRIAPTCAVATKAAVDGTTLPDGRTLTMSAAVNGSGSAYTNYFSGASFTKSGTTWSSDKYWPVSGTLDLLAVSYDELTPTSTTYSTKVSDGVTLVLPDNSSAQTDILHGSAQAQESAASTAMTFRHAGALVIFTAGSNVAYDASTNVGVTITGITLKNAYHSGTLAVTAAEDTDDGYCVWSSLGSQKDVSLPGLTSYDVPATAMDVTLDGNHMGIGGSGIIVPEQSQTSFTVNYTLHNGKDGSGNNADYTLQYTIPCTGDWEEGKKYNYVITFELNKIVVNPSVTDWSVEPKAYTLPETTSADYAVSGLTSVTLPTATMASNTEVAVYWGDGSVEAYTNATKAASMDGDDITLSHTYASAYTGNVNLVVRKGSLDFGTMDHLAAKKFTVYDGVKVILTDTKLLPGVFTVADGKTVKFTYGNLQANVNADGDAVTEWKLADNQYDYVGNTTAQQQCKDGWMDLFGWTAAGKYSDGVKQYGINTSQTSSDYYISTESGTANTDTPCDWGSLVGTGFSMLSNTEWSYLLTNALAKNSSSQNTFTIDGKSCFILKPDGYTGTVADSYTADAWATAEADGLVAIPFAGSRYGSSVYGAGDSASCWSSAPDGSGGAYYALVYAGGAGVGYDGRFSGQSVRLVSVQ